METKILTEVTGLPSDVIDKALNTRIPSDRDTPEDSNLDMEDFLFNLGVKCACGKLDILSKEYLDILSKEYLDRRNRPVLKQYTLDEAVRVAVDICKNMATPSSFDSGRFASLLNLKAICPSLFNRMLEHDDMKPYRQYLL